MNWARGTQSSRVDETNDGTASLHVSRCCPFRLVAVTVRMPVELQSSLIESWFADKFLRCRTPFWEGIPIHLVLPRKLSGEWDSCSEACLKVLSSALSSAWILPPHRPFVCRLVRSVDSWCVVCVWCVLRGSAVVSRVYSILHHALGTSHP